MTLPELNDADKVPTSWFNEVRDRIQEGQLPVNGSDLRAAGKPWFDVTHPNYGAVGDNVTDDHAAIQAAVDAAAAVGGVAYIPHGKYRLSQTLVATQPLTLMGDTRGQQNPTELHFDADVKGIHFSGSTSRLQGLALRSAGGTDTTAHGIHWNSNSSTISDVYILAFPGHGVYLDGITKNCNNNGLFSVRAHNCGRSGIFADGPDSNINTGVHLNLIGNGEYGIHDSSFLGNVWVGVHTESNVVGPIHSDNLNSRCIWLGVYAEGDQPDSSLSQRDIIIPTSYGPKIEGSDIIILRADGSLTSWTDFLWLKQINDAGGMKVGLLLEAGAGETDMDLVPAIVAMADASVGVGEFCGRFHIPATDAVGQRNFGSGIAGGRDGSTQQSFLDLYVSNGSLGAHKRVRIHSAGDNFEFFNESGTKIADLDGSGNLQIAGSLSESVVF